MKIGTAVWATVSLLCSGAYTFGPAVAAASEGVVVSNHDPSPWAGWDTGTLGFAAENANGQKKEVIVEFRGERNRSLTHLMVSTGGWSADLSKYVSALPSPFPSRIGILMMMDANGEIRGIDFELPYFLRQLDPGAKRLPECMTLEVFVEFGRVSSTSSHEDRAERCEQ